MRQWAVVIVILLISTVRLPADGGLRLFIELMFRCGVLVLVSIDVARRRNLWVGLFLLWATISQFYPRYSPDSYVAVGMVLAGVLLYDISFCLSRRRFFNFILIPIAIVNTIFAILHRLDIRFYIFPRGSVPIGLMTNQNELSALLALCSPAFFLPFLSPLPSYVGLRTWDLYRRAMILVPILGIFLSSSSGGVFGFALGACVFNPMFIPVVIVIVASFLDKVDSPSVVSRWSAWDDALRLHAKNHWFWGWGIGNWNSIYSQLVKHNIAKGGWIRLHNTFVNNLIEMGAMSSLITIGFLLSSIRRVARDPILRSALVSILVVCSCNSVFRMNMVNGALIILWLSFITRKEEHDGNSKLLQNRSNLVVASKSPGTQTLPYPE